MKRYLKRSLGLTDYCKRWIPSVFEIATPLYFSAKPSLIDFFLETKHMQAFCNLKLVFQLPLPLPTELAQDFLAIHIGQSGQAFHVMC